MALTRADIHRLKQAIKDSAPEVFRHVAKGIGGSASDLKIKLIDQGKPPNREAVIDSLQTCAQEVLGRKLEDEEFIYEVAGKIVARSVSSPSRGR